jgi:hypothetical protein
MVCAGRPHPSAQLRFTGVDGHRLTTFAARPEFGFVGVG